MSKSSKTFSDVRGAADGAIIVGLAILAQGLAAFRGKMVEAGYNLFLRLSGTENEGELTPPEAFMLISTTLTLVGGTVYLISQNALQEEDVKNIGQADNLDSDTS